MQILRDTPAELELNVYQNGTSTDLDADPTLTVTDANGDPVTSGAVTKPVGTTGVYRSILPAQANLKALRAIWTGALDTEPVSFTQHHEIVGNLLFTEAEARATTITGLQTPLSDETKYADADIARMRELIGSQFEDLTGRSWIRRYARVELSGNSRRTINIYPGQFRNSDGNEVGGSGRWLSIAKLIAVSIGGDPVDVSTLDIRGRNIIRDAGSWTWSDTYNIVVEYEYGDDPVDLEANENARRMAVTNLVPSDLSQYTQSFTGQEGNLIFPTGGFVWPNKVKEWLERNPRLRLPGFA